MHDSWSHRALTEENYMKMLKIFAAFLKKHCLQFIPNLKHRNSHSAVPLNRNSNTQPLSNTESH